MAIEWTPNLSVGVDTIDEQHKVWFQKANDLFEAGQQRRTKEIIGQTLDYLDEYTKFHFNDEEEYMESINYPELETQRNAHKSFISKLAELKETYAKSGGNILLIIEANQFVVDWLTRHISIMDKKIGEYVAQK